MNLYERLANLRNDWIMRRPESQHLFWSSSLGLIATMLLTWVAFAVCSAVWSLYLGAIAACLGGAFCCFLISANYWLENLLGSAPRILAKAVVVTFIIEGAVLVVVAYGLARHSVHAAFALAPVLLLAVVISALVMSGIFRQPDPPTDNTGDSAG